MRFTLGGRTYDLTSRSLVVGRADTVATAHQFVDAGADVIEFANAANAAAASAATATLDVPIGIAAARLDEVRAAYQAGAVLGTWLAPDPAPFLAASAAAGATVIVADPAPALEAGLPPERIAVEAPTGHLVTTDDIGAMAVAVTNGARLIRTTNVKGARRVADVLAAILEASA